MSNILIWGTGNIGRKHIGLLSHRKGVKVYALSKHNNRMALVPKEIQRIDKLSTTQSMGIQHCIIASRTRDHWHDLQLALACNLKVLVEKPFWTRLPNSKQVQRVPLAARRRCWVGFPLRYSKSLRCFQQQLSRIGRIHRVEIACRSYLPEWRPRRPYLETYSAKRSEGGVLLDLIHEIDYATWLFGWPTSLFAILRNTGSLSIQSEEIAEMMWQTPQGAQISISLDYLSRPAQRMTRAYGHHGTLEWNGMTQEVHLKRHALSPKRWRFRQTLDQMRLALDSAFLGVGGNKPLNAPSFHESLRLMALCDAARVSARTEKVQRIQYPRTVR